MLQIRSAVASRPETFLEIQSRSAAVAASNPGGQFSTFCFINGHGSVELQQRRRQLLFENSNQSRRRGGSLAFVSFKIPDNFSAFTHACTHRSSSRPEALFWRFNSAAGDDDGSSRTVNQAIALIPVPVFPKKTDWRPWRQQRHIHDRTRIEQFSISDNFCCLTRACGSNNDDGNAVVSLDLKAQELKKNRGHFLNCRRTL